MNKKILVLAGVLLVALVAAALLFFRPGAAQNPGSAADAPEADPQRLMIPRWFLLSMKVDGQEIAVPEGQQKMTLQFQEGGQANGEGGCNGFGATYETGPDGKMDIREVMSTMMFCEEWSPLEGPYFQALEKIDRFSTENYQLKLYTAGGQTELVFIMPPK